jgi:hypothetical protein
MDWKEFGREVIVASFEVVSQHVSGWRKIMRSLPL